MKTSYVFLATGFEEIEAIAPVDILRRAGMEVKTVSTIAGTKTVCGAHGVPVTADLSLEEVNASDALWFILPGGLPGATNLAGNEKLSELLIAHYGKGGRIAAICASPAVVLYPLGILDGKTATCYPGFEDSCPNTTISGNRVEATETLITSNGPSSALLFGLAIVEQTLGKEKADEIASGMLL